MKYFTLQECIYSATAVARGIDNTPTPEIKAHIVESVEMLLDPLREAWQQYCEVNKLGSPGINISSGYRCPALNKEVHGSKTSAHMSGYAFDLVPTKEKNKTNREKIMEFKKFCRNYLANKAFDQLISEGEDDSGMPCWMHVGYKHPDGVQQRRKTMSMIHGKYVSPMTE
uniref:Peptidase n=1 Tax=Myoviridae sp. ctVeR24 TaxID=2827689 RepID=A0A8S5SY53_9CAUD|nr:MAG TPA: peptidase [Myoviridae sp. ctVeR24]